MLRVVVRSGDRVGAEAVLEPDSPPLIVGRGPDCGLRLPEPHVSSRHGRFEHDGEAFLFRDLMSTNGSYLRRGSSEVTVGAAGVESVRLEDGDVILVGDRDKPVVLEIRLDDQDDDSRDVLAIRKIDDLPSLTMAVSRRPDRIAVLYRVSLEISKSGVDLGQVLDNTAKAIVEVVPKITHIGIFLEEDGRFVKVLGRVLDPSCPDPEEEARALRLSRTLLARVRKERAAILASNAAKEFSSSHSIARARILSTLCVPLWDGDQIIGLIQADNRTVAGTFDESDLEVLTVLASQLSLSLRNARLYAKLQRAEAAARREAGYLKSRERSERTLIIGDSPAMRRVLELVDRVKDTPVPVCILGETGTGKELIARKIHYESDRAERLFVAQNMAALPDSLLESELFGHKRGAFTGADRDKKGLFELADGGTIFLDEIGDISPALQAKLLRVIQEGEVRPVGSNRTLRVDVRIISATHRDLEAEVQAGRFRHDLFYRLMVFPIHLPPLRERREDIPLLARFFLGRYSKELKRPEPSLSPAALDVLTAYSWPGNIRELENEIQRLVIYGAEGGLILPEHLSPRVRQTAAAIGSLEPGGGTLKEMVAEVERVIISRTLEKTGGNKTKAAAILGLTREGLHKKMNKLGFVR